MKKQLLLPYIGIVFFVVLSACHEKQPDKNRQQTSIANTIYKKSFTELMMDTVLQPLDFLYQNLAAIGEDPNLNQEALACIMAYADVKQDLLYLDSVRQMHISIDFVGSRHSDWQADDEEVLQSQKNVYQLLSSGHYGVVGYESSSKVGFLSKEDMQREIRIELAASGLDTSQSVVALVYAENAKYDAVQKYIEHGNNNVTGTEPEAFWYLEQKILFLVNTVDQRHYSELYDKIGLALNEVRSAVAIAKVARVMQAEKRNSAVIVYGANHMPHFVWLAKAFNIESEFFDTI